MSDDSKKKKTPIFKKWWFWVIIILVVVLIGASAASSDKDAKKVGENDDSSIQDSNQDNTKFKIGDIIAIDNREMTVEKVSRNWSAEYSKPKDGKEYIMITVKLENKSDDKISYTSGDWKLENSDGAIDSPAIVLGNDDSIGYGDLAAGGKKTGTIVFEIPEGDTDLKIHYKPNMFLDREAIVELQ